MKKQFKKSLALLLSLLMIITVVPLTAGAEEVSDCYTYNVDISGRAEIISVDSSISGDIIIPTYIDGYKVIKIGDNAFENCDNITSVTIPDSVYYIGYRAFYGCDNLAAISFGDSLNGIYSEAFMSCTKLTDVSWGKSLRDIGDDAFAYTSLATLTIPDTVQFIGDNAYAGIDITEIIIPDSVTYLGEGAFKDCVNLESVTLSKSLETIKSETFYNCEKLTKIEIPDNVTTIEDDVFDGIPILDITLGKSLKELSSDSFLYSYQTNLNSINIHDENKFFYTDGQALFYEDEVKGMTTLVLFYDKTAESYSIPDGVERIGEYAFWGFGSLKSIEIPESVLSIGKYAFANCYGLKYEYIDGLRYYGDVLYDRDGEASSFTDTITVREGTRIIADGLFEYKYDGYYPENIKMKEVILPEGVVSIGNRAFLGCKTLQKINLPDSLTYIGDEAFYRCSELACEIIPDSVEYIGDDTFSACSNIAVTSLPENLKYLGNSAFSSSKNVTQIVIPETVTYLGENNFKNIVSIDIPASVKLIEDNFNDYLKLESIHVDMNNKYFSSENGVLFNKDKTELLKYPSAKSDVKYVMPDTVLHLRNAAFWDNEYITEIILSESLKDIGSNCFLACSALKCLEIPESVETIYDFFYGCDSLADIVVSGTVEFRHSIDYNVPFVKNSDNWQDGMLIVGGTLMDVDESSMTELVIPDTVKYLSAAVFGQTTLTSITIPDSVKLIPNGAFHHSKSLRELRISSSIEQIGLRPFYDCDNLTDVYYSGTAEQWNNIKKESDAPFYNEDYFGADVHFVECVFTSDFKHSYTPEITIPATHLTEGVLTFTCACGDTYTESIEKIAEHNYIAAEIVEPTCSREGYTVYICACGATCTDDYVDYDYSVHVNEDGDKICDYCGELTEYCACNCHSTNGFIAFFWKILNFLQRLFGTNPVCECGMAHY